VYRRQVRGYKPVLNRAIDLSKERVMKKYMLGALVCLVGTCAVAIIFKVLSLPELPSTFIGAALGAAITGSITLFLLAGQTESQEVKERNMKVFENKSKIFQDYIKYVWQVWEDHYLDPVEYETLIARYCSELMIYIKNEKNMDKITKCLLNLVGNADKINNIGNRDPKSVENLRSNLFELINTLSEELGVGGTIDLDAQKQLEDSLTPILFRKTLLSKMNEMFVAHYPAILEAAKYEHYPWFNGVDAEFISIDFNGLKQRIKIMIGPFNGPKYYGEDGERDEQIRFRIYADITIRQLDGYRHVSKGVWRQVIKQDNNDLYLNDRLDNTQKKGGFEKEIRFHFPEINDEYRENYERICVELANRAEYIFDILKVGDDKISIPDFYNKCKELIGGDGN
jgi:hypothetical protein